MKNILIDKIIPACLALLIIYFVTLVGQITFGVCDGMRKDQTCYDGVAKIEYLLFGHRLGCYLGEKND